jgi:non-specific serine/threonine protein kinase/serine/threonine-protein kinase
MTSPADPSSARFARIKEAFSGALDEPAEARDSWLRDRYPPDIAAEASALLSAYRKADSFLERPAFANARAASLLEEMLPLPGADALPIGTRLAPYVITDHLGDGGMGRVFRARRDDHAFEQQVAIKVVRAEVATPAMVERLRQERRILAALDHPNIARLIDGGSTGAGLPYAVMELVEGVPINRYCDERDLDVAARLRLLRTVCGAVQYAHERLIVHRDLKPANILVTPDGTPKLLDFGISKILAPDQTDRERTRTEWAALTPQYASPEQIRGATVGVASDVYALGVLAYELLSSASPYGPGSAESRVALERAILEEDPPPPSRVAPRSRQRALRGDLDRIVLKALEKPLERRYANVEQLSDDLSRHANGLPVSAAPNAWAYRARKFISRHRIGVAVAAATALTLVAGGATTWYQARIARAERAVAEQRFEQVRGLANAFLFEFPNAIKDRTGATEARKEAVTRALAYLDGPAGDNQDDPRLLAETARAYLALGDVLGNPYVANLGDPDRAEESYLKALARAERLTARTGAPPGDWMLLVQAHMACGDIRWSKADTAGALTHYQAALDLTNRREMGPDRPALRYARGHALYLIGQSQLKSGRITESLPFFERASVEAKACLAMPTVDADCQRILNTSEAKLGDVYRLQGDPTRALVHSQAASRLAHETADRAPDRRDLKHTLVIIDIRYASDLAATGALTDAMALFSKTCDTAVALSNADPSDVQAAADIGLCMGTWARSALDGGQLDISARAFERTIAALTPLARTSSHYENRLELARAYEGLATVLLRRSDDEGVIAAAERGRNLLEPMLATTPTAAPFLADVYDLLVDALGKRARRADRAAAERDADWKALLGCAEKYTKLMRGLDADGLLDKEDAGWERRIEDRAATARLALARVNTGRQ